MRKLLLLILTLFTVSSFAQGFANMSVAELTVLSKYIMDMNGPDATLEEALDDEDVSTNTFMYNGEILNMMIVYSGDTPHGPIFVPKTLEIVGLMSDGSVEIRGKDVDIDDLNYELDDKLVDVLIDDFFCGEMDPFVVGDVCILFVSHGDKKTAVLFDFDSLADVDVDGLAGKKAKMNKTRLSKIYNRDVLEVLIDYDNEYFYMNTYFTLEEVLIL